MIVVSLICIRILIHSGVTLLPDYYFSEIVNSFLPYSIMGHIIIAIILGYNTFASYSKKVYNITCGIGFMIISSILLICYNNYNTRYDISPLLHSDLQQNNISKLSILYGNIYYKNDNFTGLMQTINKHNPDIIMFVEYAKLHDEALKPLLSKQYPYRNRYVGGKHFDGDVIYSRYPLHKIEHEVYPGSRSFTHVTLQKGKKYMDIALVHTSAPISPEFLTQRNQQIEKLSDILGNYYHTNNHVTTRNIIVLGDFNLSPRSNTYTSFNDNMNQLGLQNLTTKLHTIEYPYHIPYTRCHNQIPIACSHIDHMRSNNIKASLSHINIPGSDHDGFVGIIDLER